ncbi:GMC oxidoreductase [Rhizobium sp. Leaf262]|uniref:GMC oxidoreductase n=1 Tax=Rhizobium sp. Leaf262 TaxID=1736312 RepID=UPI000713E81A|nr:GMC oxidoreductase [Rhizobium sp. Leaf262]KQO76264.1 hypothetical protein ASF29_09780 [Rhizobium sp. Leaf262]
MTIFHLPQIDHPSMTISGELCVIGAGIAGLLIANRIAKAGRKVIVIESGKDKFDPEIHDLNAVEDVDGRYSRELDGRFRGLGGSSSRWGGRLIPMSGHDTARRDHIGMPAWPLDVASLDCYGEEIEKLFGVANGSFEKLPEINSRGALSLLGNGHLETRWAKCPSLRNCNLAHVLRRELSKNPNIEIWLEATVCDFDLDRDSGFLREITARNFAGKSLTVKAGRFVFTAGTIETTKLMLLMDRCANEKMFAKPSVIGRYFQDHLKVEVATIGRYDAVMTNRLFAYRYVNSTRRDLHLDLGQTAQTQGGVASAFAYIAMDVVNSPLAALRRVAKNLQRRQLDLRELVTISKNTGLVAQAAYWRAVRKQLFVPKDVNFKVMICAEQLPEWKNRISLSPALDRLGMPKAQIEWQPMPSEERTFRIAVARLADYWKSAALDQKCPLMLNDLVQDPAGSIIAKSEACAHPSGTTRMGTNPADSIVGPDLHCHAVPNVSIVSASVFPTAGSANPTFTIMKLAYSFADNYLKRA